MGLEAISPGSLAHVAPDLQITHVELAQFLGPHPPNTAICGTLHIMPPVRPEGCQAIQGIQLKRPPPFSKAALLQCFPLLPQEVACMGQEKTAKNQADMLNSLSKFWVLASKHVA